jgi:lysophospholipase L1-like esterase
MTKKNLLLLAVLTLFVLFQGAYTLKAQDPSRFQSQVTELANASHHPSPSKQFVLFTGSSSVRMWTDVQSYFPGYFIVNNGFGGSHFSDLLYYYQELVLNFKPDILFVYEGDNDIASGKKPGKVLKEAKELAERIEKDLPSTKVVFISAKPSVARWHLKKEYQAFNKKLERLCKSKANFEFADVWEAMTDKNGNVFKDVFLKDDLHMNKKGYDIWGEVMGQFLK